MLKITLSLFLYFMAAGVLIAAPAHFSPDWWQAHPNAPAKADEQAQRCQDLGQFDKAIAGWELAEEGWLALGDSLRWMDCRALRARTLALKGDREACIALMEASVPHWEHADSEKQLRLCEAWLNFAYAYGRSGDLEQALAWYGHILELCEKIGAAALQTKAMALNDRGMFMGEEGMLAEAMADLQEALALLEGLGEAGALDRCDVYGNLAMVYNQAGDLAQSRAYLQKAFAGMREILPSYHRSCLFLLASLATTEYQMGNLAVGMRNLEEGMAILEDNQSQDYEVLGNFHLSALAMYTPMGEEEKARRSIKVLQEKVLPYLEREDGMRRLYCNNVGGFYMSIGDFEQAAAFFEQGKGNAATGTPIDQYALHCYFNCGHSYIEMERYQLAEDNILVALSAAKAMVGESHPLVARCLVLLGNAKLYLGEYEAADSILQKGLAIMEVWQQPIDVHASLYVGLGANSFYQGDIDQALAYLRQSLELAEQNSGPGRELKLRNYRAIVYGLLGAERFQEAYSYTDKALALFSDSGGQVDTGSLSLEDQWGGDLKLLTDILRHRAVLAEKLYRMEGDSAMFEEAQGTVRLGMRLLAFMAERRGSEREREALYRDHLSIFETGLSLAKDISEQPGRRLEGIDLALSYSERFKSNQLLKAIRLSGVETWRGMPPGLLQLDQQLRQQYARTEQKRIEARMQGRAEADSLEGQLLQIKIRQDSVAEVFRKQHPDYYRLKVEQEVGSLEEVRTKILAPAPGTALLEYFWGEHAATLIAISSQDAQLYHISLEDSVAENAILEMRAALAGQAPGQDFEASSRKVYQTFLAPALEGPGAIAGAEDLRRLIFVPDGPLRGIPFDALLTEGEAAGPAPYLLRRFAISYAFSSSVLLENIRKAAGMPQQGNGRILAFSPDFEASWEGQGIFSNQKPSSLQASADMLGRLQDRFQGQFLMGAEATEAAFKRERGSTSILHLNTHGFFNDSLPLHSGILFQSGGGDEDGVLYTRELFDMAIDTRLAILAACNTGFGREQAGENLMSMSRGFAYAGCPTMVTSLWEQDESSTARILELFYGELEQGLPVDEALRNAKLAYIGESDQFSAQPRFWAQLIPVGEMRSIPLGKKTNNRILLLAGGLALALLGGSIGLFGRKRT